MVAPFTENLCTHFLPNRRFSEVIEMDLINQQGHIAAYFIKQSLKINLAVHLVSLPVLLCLFHRFPLVSLIYNFFFPFWVSISLLLLCSALLITLICPPLAHWIHGINEGFTRSALHISSTPPAILDFVIRTNKIPLFGVILFLTFLFIGIIYWEERRKKLICN
jgi:competence protein ComEC